MKKIYLAYGIEQADINTNRKRGELIKEELIKLGYEVFNPLGDEQEILNQCNIENAEAFKRLKSEDIDKYIVSMRHIRNSDISILLDSDAIIAFLDKTLTGGGGVAGELTVASVCSIPIFTIVNKNDIQQIPGWVLSFIQSKTTFDTIEQCIKYLKEHPINETIR